MKQPASNVKIDWSYDNALWFEIDINNGEFVYEYRPEDNNLEVRGCSRSYERAEWYLNESEQLPDYIEEQVRSILNGFNEVVQRHQKGFINMDDISEETGYDEEHA